MTNTKTLKVPSVEVNSQIQILKFKLQRIEGELTKCRTSSMQHGWQTSKHAKKSRKWDFYAQEKMRLINELDKLGAL